MVLLAVGCRFCAVCRVLLLLLPFDGEGGNGRCLNMHIFFHKSLNHHFSVTTIHSNTRMRGVASV